MPDALFLTPQELGVGTPGNAALGGVTQNFDPNNPHPLQGLQDTFTRLDTENNAAIQQKAQQQRQFQHDLLSKQLDQQNQMAVLKQQNAWQKQRDLFTMLNQSGGTTHTAKGPNGEDMSIPFLSADQDQVDQAANDITKKMTSDPNGYGYSSDFQKDWQDRGHLNTNASMRAYYAAQARQDLASSALPELKQKAQDYLDYLNKTPLDSKNPPPPYISPTLSVQPLVDMKEWNDPKKMESFDAGLGVPNRVYAGYETTDNPKELAYGYSSFQHFQNSPQGTDPSEYNEYQKHFNELRASRGQQPIDLGGAVGQDGKVHFDATTPDKQKSIARKFLTAYNEMQTGTLQNDPNSESDAADLVKKKADARKSNAEAAKSELEAKLEKDGKPSKPMTPTEIAEDKDSRVTVKRVKQVFNPARYSGPGASVVTGTEKVDGEDKQTYRTIAGVDVAKTLKDKGLKPEDWGVFIAPAGEADDLIGVERKGKLNTGAEQRTGETIPAAKQFILKNKQTGDLRLASYGKDGEKYALQSMVDGRTAVGNAAKAKHEYKTENSKMSEEIDRNEGVWDEYDKPATSTSASNVAKQTNTPTRKTIGNKTWEKNSKGDWIKINQ